MLRNKNGSTFVPVPHQPTTANKCEYVFLTGYAAYPSGVTLGAFLFEDEAAFHEQRPCNSLTLGTFDVSIKDEDIYGAMHKVGTEFFPDFEVCSPPQRPKEEDAS